MSAAPLYQYHWYGHGRLTTEPDEVKCSLSRSLCIATACSLLMASAASAQSPTLGPRGTPPPDEDIAKVYAETADLPFDEALRRYRAQKQIGPLRDKLEERLDDRFAGVWVDEDTGAIGVGATTSDDARAAEQALAEVGLADAGYVRGVETTQEDLDAAVTALTTELLAGIQDDQVSVSRDERANRVQVKFAPRASEEVRRRAGELRAEFARGRMTHGPAYRIGGPAQRPEQRPDLSRMALGPARKRTVTVVESDGPAWQSQPSNCTSESCGLPLRAGVKTRSTHSGVQHQCSAGYIGTWWSGSATFFFLQTAGHCLVGTPAAWNAYDPQIGQWRQIGGRNSWSAGVHRSHGHLPQLDIGTIAMPYSSYWTNVLAPVLWMKGWTSAVGWNPNYWPVQSWNIAAQGEFGCRTGFVSSFSCGTVINTSRTVNYGYGTINNVFEIAGACNNDGDSGGAFINGTKALGITSGRLTYTNGACHGVYAHVHDIAYWLGVHPWV